MLNYKRRQRQADENSSIIIERFRVTIEKKEDLYSGRYCIRNEQELLQLVETIRDELHTRANRLSPDWSIPILLESIGSMYYGKHREQMKYGPFFKRALAYLWKVGVDRGAEMRNLDGLLDVLKLSYVIEILYGFRRFF